MKKTYYVIGFYTKNGVFTVTSRLWCHNLFPTWEMAEEKCKELQPHYKHKLEPKKI